MKVNFAICDDSVVDSNYVKELVNNNAYKQQATKVASKTNEATISNNYDTATSYVELKVRDEAIADKNSSYIYNQYTKYTNFEFKDNYLYLRGNSYSYGMNLSKDTKVTRNIVFEEKTDWYLVELGKYLTEYDRASFTTPEDIDESALFLYGQYTWVKAQ